MPSRRKKSAANQAAKRARSPSPIPVDEVSDKDSGSEATPTIRSKKSRSREPSSEPTLKSALAQMANAVTMLMLKSSDRPVNEISGAGAESSAAEIGALMLLPASQLIQTPQAVARVLLAIRDPMERAAKAESIMAAIVRSPYQFEGG